LERVASNYNLDMIGRKYHLDTIIRATRQDNVEPASNYVAGTVEAILGATYLDSGMTSVKMVMSNLGLEYESLDLARFTTDPQLKQEQNQSSQQGLVCRITRSVDALQRSIVDVLCLGNWTQLWAASVDPNGILNKATISGSQFLQLLTTCQDTLLKSATPEQEWNIMEVAGSAHDLQSLISTPKSDMKIRLSRQGFGLRGSSRDFHRARTVIKSSWADLLCTLHDSHFIDPSLTKSIEQQVFRNYQDSIQRLQNVVQFWYPVLAFAPNAPLTTLQEHIAGVSRSGRQVLGAANSLEALRRDGLPRWRAHQLIPLLTRPKVTQHNKNSFPQRIESQSAQSDKQSQDLVSFFRDPAMQQAIRNIERSFHRLSLLMEELLSMISTTRLILLRKALENVVMSGRQTQSIANFIRQSTSTLRTQDYKTSLMHMNIIQGDLHSGQDPTSETRLAYLCKLLEDVIKPGREVQGLTDSFNNYEVHRPISGISEVSRA